MLHFARAGHRHLRSPRHRSRKFRRHHVPLQSEICGEAEDHAGQRRHCGAARERHSHAHLVQPLPRFRARSRTLLSAAAPEARRPPFSRDPGFRTDRGWRLDRRIRRDRRQRRHRARRRPAPARRHLRGGPNRRPLHRALTRRRPRVLPDRKPRDPAEWRGRRRRRLRFRQTGRQHALQDRPVRHHCDRGRCRNPEPYLGRPRDFWRDPRAPRSQDRQPRANRPQLRRRRGQHHLRTNGTRRQLGHGKKCAAGRTGRTFRASHRSRRRDYLRPKRHWRRCQAEGAHVGVAGVRRIRLAARHHGVPKAAGDPAHCARIEKENRERMSAPASPPPQSRPPLAYKNDNFLKGPDSRPLRILSEYLEPLSHFRRQEIRDTIVFFGSARIREEGPLAEYYRDARALAAMLTKWAKTLRDRTFRYVICSGGGPGIMEAANRGASDAKGKTIGLNIGLPFEQFPNPYITHELNFEFHYFFMRKFWFAYLSKALVVFPGGFGTMDELFEILTLVQTQKLAKKITIILYGSGFWKEVINFDALVKYGTISPEDLNLFHFADTPDAAMQILKDSLLEQPPAPEGEIPAISHSVKPDEPSPAA